MTNQNDKPMVVRVLINGEKQLLLTMHQDDPSNQNSRVGLADLGEARLQVLVSGDVDGADTAVYFNLWVKEEVVSPDSEVATVHHEIWGKEPVSGAWNWKSVSWDRELPARPNFPGEPPLPRTMLKVTLELEEAKLAT